MKQVIFEDKRKCYKIKRYNTDLFCPLTKNEAYCGDWCMWFDIEEFEQMKGLSKHLIKCKDIYVAELVE